MSNTLKSEYNLHLSNARASLNAAFKLRKDLIAADPTLSGPSVGHLATAVEAAYQARTFANLPGDLEAKDNTFRTNLKVGGKKTRARLGL
jgi:hypothetical protein